MQVYKMRMCQKNETIAKRNMIQKDRIFFYRNGVCPLVQYYQNDCTITCNCATEGLRMKSTCTIAYIEENEALTENSIFKLKNIVRYAHEEYGKFL